MHAKDIMTRSVVTVEPSPAMMHAIRLMLQKRISGLPVVNSAGRLVGTLTEGDLLRCAETGTQGQKRSGLFDSALIFINAARRRRFSKITVSSSLDRFPAQKFTNYFANA